MSSYDAARQDLDRYIAARVPLVAVRTIEQQRALRLVEEVAGTPRRSSLPFWVFTRATGLRDLRTNTPVHDDRSLTGAMDHAAAQFTSRAQSTTVFVGPGEPQRGLPLHPAPRRAGPARRRQLRQRHPHHRHPAVERSAAARDEPRPRPARRRRDVPGHRRLPRRPPRRRPDRVDRAGRPAGRGVPRRRDRGRGREPDGHDRRQGCGRTGRRAQLARFKDRIFGDLAGLERVHLKESRLCGRRADQSAFVAVPAPSADDRGPAGDRPAPAARRPAGRRSRLWEVVVRQGYRRRSGGCRCTGSTWPASSASTSASQRAGCGRHSTPPTVSHRACCGSTRSRRGWPGRTTAPGSGGRLLGQFLFWLQESESPGVRRRHRQRRPLACLRSCCARAGSTSCSSSICRTSRTARRSSPSTTAGTCGPHRPGPGRPAGRALGRVRRVPTSSPPCTRSARRHCSTAVSSDLRPRVPPRHVRQHLAAEPDESRADRGHPHLGPGTGGPRGTAGGRPDPTGTGDRPQGARPG